MYCTMFIKTDLIRMTDDIIKSITLYIEYACL